MSNHAAPNDGRTDQRPSRLTVVVGITGGIAAYKAVGVVRGLVKLGHDVHVVPTEGALRFIGLPTLEAISRNPVATSVFADVAEVRHVALGRQADLVVIAPATADSIARMAHGFAGDLLGTTLLATTAPVVIAPAMHPQMWEHAATRANVETLRTRGVHICGPEVGALTGDDAGIGRMSEPDDIVAAALRVLSGAEGRHASAGQAAVPDVAGTGVPATSATGERAESRGEPADSRGDLPGAPPVLPTSPDARHGDLSGTTIVVSAGGTREPIDPVRFVGNRSSGRQGVAIAVEAARRGAAVTLVSANVAAEVLPAKLKKDAQGDVLTLELIRNPDVLAGLVAARRPGQLVVGFAAETEPDREARIALGREKIARKPADLLVVNRVGWSQGFEREDNAIEVLTPGGEVVREAAGTKAEVAHVLLDLVATALT